MVEPNDMRFYCTDAKAEPVGSKAAHTVNGRPRRVYSAAEASASLKWPMAALVALFNATYPQAGGVDDPRQGELAEAMFQRPDVRDAMLHALDGVGTLPPATFLLALLIEWDMAGDEEGRNDTILEALGAKPFKSRKWFGPGLGGDLGQYGRAGGDHA